MNRSLFFRIACTATGVVTVVSLAACGSSSSPTASASSATSAAAPAGPTYSTKYFTTPVDVAVPSWLEPAPTDDTAHFVTFDSSDGSRKVRILSPVVVYPPGSSTTTPIPKDYVSYLLGQAANGGHFVERVDTKVDGRPATVLTATTSHSLDGSLGCPDTGISAGDCFGLQPEVIARLAVITADQGPLLIWLRNDVDNHPDMKVETQRFAQFLAGVHFSERAPQAAPAPVSTALDGTYEWTLTKQDALAHGTAGDKTPEALANFPITFTVALEKGDWNMSDSADTDTGEGTFTVTGNHLDFHWSGSVLSFTFTRDAGGALHLTAVPPMDPGDQFVWTTRAWTRKQG
jgi:hypothetical protein